MIGEAKGNHKQIWDKLKKLTGKWHNNTTKQLEIRDNGSLINGAIETATLLNSYFVNSVKMTVPINHTGILVTPQTDISQSALSLMEVSESKVNIFLNSLKTSKSKDIFGLDSIFLKRHADLFTGTITKLVNASIKEGKFPKDWNSAIVVPVYKSGDPTVASNYRPISILPVISKIAEKCIAEQLLIHLNSSPYTLHPMQFGFRANHSTETANCFLLENIKLKMDKGGVVGAIFLDLKKAFDTVDHQILICKLANFNLSPNVLNWMQSYLTGRVQCVRVGSATSPFLSNEMGVPQGSILGPLLFSLYINDLPSVCTGCDVQMYADDTVIYVHAKTKEQAASKLGAIMINVNKWLNDSNLVLNVKKTVCMFFTKTHSVVDCDPKMCVSGEIIQVVSHVKYLGIILDSTLSFKKQVKKVLQITNYNLANFRYIRNCLTTIAAKLYINSMIIPHLTYCMTTWSQVKGTTLKPILSLYKQAYKVLGRKTQYLPPLQYFGQI